MYVVQVLKCKTLNWFTVDMKKKKNIWSNNVRQIRQHPGLAIDILFFIRINLHTLILLRKCVSAWTCKWTTQELYENQKPIELFLFYPASSWLINGVLSALYMSIHTRSVPKTHKILYFSHERILTVTATINNGIQVHTH